MIIKFYRQLGRSVLQRLCDHLNTTELFKQGHGTIAGITSDNAKEDSARCITISCLESPLAIFYTSMMRDLQKEFHEETKDWIWGTEY